MGNWRDGHQGWTRETKGVVPPTIGVNQPAPNVLGASGNDSDANVEENTYENAYARLKERGEVAPDPDGGPTVSPAATLLDQVTVFDNAQINGNAILTGNARISGNAEIADDAHICDNADVRDDARVFGKARVHGQVYGNAQVGGNAIIPANALVGDDALVTEPKHVYTFEKNGITHTVYRTGSRQQVASKTGGYYGTAEINYKIVSPADPTGETYTNGNFIESNGYMLPETNFVYEGDEEFSDHDWLDE